MKPSKTSQYLNSIKDLRRLLDFSLREETETLLEESKADKALILLDSSINEIEALCKNDQQ